MRGLLSPFISLLFSKSLTAVEESWAAFETIDHELLLLRLEHQFGLRGTPVTWFRSHLSSRTYRVMFAAILCSRLCYVQGRLLQSAVGRSTKVCYRQVAANHECCSASCEQHEEVRRRLDTLASLWAALAQCDRSSHIQAWGDGVQVLAWPLARHRIICLTCAHRSLKLLNDSIFVLPAAIYSLFHGFSLIRTAVIPSLSLDRHGTCSKTICVSRTCKWTVFVIHWRRFFLISTWHTERTRGVFCDDALYKWTFTLHFCNII